MFIIRKLKEIGSVEFMHVVIFTGGEYTKPEQARIFFESIKTPDFVIAADSGLVAAIDYSDFYSGKIDFSPDVITGDMDSLKESAANNVNAGNGTKFGSATDASDILKNFPSAKIIKHNPYKDFSDTELALEYAYENCMENHRKDCRKGVRSEQVSSADFFVTIIGGAGGRIDHLLGIFDLFSEENHPDAWLYNSQILWYAKQGSVFEISNLGQHDYISVARTNGSRSGGKIISDGLEWESDLFRKEGMPSLSNRISEKAFAANKKVSIKVDEGDFILILPVTAKVHLKSL